MNGKIPAMLSPAYPWGQGDPQRMVDPDIKPAVHAEPEIPGGSAAGVVVAGIVVTALAVLTFRVFRRKRK